MKPTIKTTFRYIGKGLVYLFLCAMVAGIFFGLVWIISRIFNIPLSETCLVTLGILGILFFAYIFGYLSEVK